MSTPDLYQLYHDRGFILASEARAAGIDTSVSTSLCIPQPTPVAPTTVLDSSVAASAPRRDITLYRFEIRVAKVNFTTLYAAYAGSSPLVDMAEVTAAWELSIIREIVERRYADLSSRKYALGKPLGSYLTGSLKRASQSRLLPTDGETFAKPSPCCRTARAKPSPTPPGIYTLKSTKQTSASQLGAVTSTLDVAPCVTRSTV